jgi:hypothetical protein
MSYLDEHRVRLRKLFAILGEDWPDGNAELIRQMERRWLGSEHGADEAKPKYDAAVRDEAWPILRELGLVDRVEPPRDHYNQIVVMGAANIGVHRRLELVRESRVGADRMVVLSGMRPHAGKSRDGALDELIASDGRFAAVADWELAPNLAARAAELAALDQLEAARMMFPAETDAARLLLTKHWPDLKLVGTEPLRHPDEVVNDLGPRRFLYETYAGSVPIPEVILFNGAPVQRERDGEDLGARPTSRSTINEWIDNGLATKGSVLLVVNQPHLTRVRIEVVRELETRGLLPERVDVAGANALQQSVDLNLLLGEIPARINVG